VANLDPLIGDKIPVLSRAAKEALHRAAAAHGLLASGAFLRQCAAVWGAVGNPATTVVAVVGPMAVGKTAARRTALAAMAAAGAEPDLLMHGNARQLAAWRAAGTVKRAFVHWRQARAARWKRGVSNSSSSSSSSGGEGSEVPALRLQVTVIHHASLPVQYLLGAYDSKGAWMDGLLTRAIRRAQVRQIDRHVDRPLSTPLSRAQVRQVDT